MLDGELTQTVLSNTLRDACGAGLWLKRWTASPLSKRGKHRAVRYALDARQTGVPRLQHFEWVGKFYEREEDACRVAAVLRELAASDCRARGDAVIPRVIASRASIRLLLLAYEPGESVIAALARNPTAVLSALARALAALHATPVAVNRFVSPSSILAKARRRVAALCARFPSQSDVLRQMLHRLEREAPGGSAPSSFLHGDLGPVQLLWQAGRIVILDFDKCARGDPALDLGNLLTQLRRLTLRKPGKLTPFALLRRDLLEAYQRHAPPDPELLQRVGWYEHAMLLGKIHFLASDSTRHHEAAKLRQRRAEAVRLLKRLPQLLDFNEAPDELSLAVQAGPSLVASTSFQTRFR